MGKRERERESGAITAVCFSSDDNIKETLRREAVKSLESQQFRQ